MKNDSKKMLKQGTMFRDIRWLNSRQRQFVALSAEQMAFYEDVDEVRPKLLHCLPFNQTSELEHLQCFDLSPLSDEALALGYANGKVVITKVAAEPDIRNLNDIVELVCDVPKPVTSLNFSSITETYLAACFEGGRSQDYTVCVYDISSPKLHVFCVNCNERVMDFTWLRSDPSILCLGCSRSIKFFDIREGTRPVCSVPVSNQVRSISAGDVHFCIACIIDDFAYIYDRRRLKSPLYMIQLSYFKKNDAGAVKILWNPHSPTCLSCFRRNSRVVTELISPCESILEEHCITEMPNFPMSDTIDLVQGGSRGTRYSEDIGSTKLPHPYLELNYKFFGISRVSGFSWHPENRDRLLVVAPDGGRGAFEVRLATVNKFVTGDYSSQGFFAHASGNQLYVRSADPVVAGESVDISFVMKSRAAKNFGSPPSSNLEAYIRSCKEIIDCCPYSTSEVKWLWEWIHHMISIVDWKPCIYGTLFPGVMDIMQHSLNSDKDELTTERIFVFDPFLGRIRLYSGKERNRVLRICGWPALGDTVQLDAFIDENVTKRRKQSRAVAAALVTANSVRMKKTLNSMLEKARESNDEGLPEMEAFQEALQHYRGLPEQWKSVSKKLRSIVRDPYFNMIITFLDGRCDNFSDLHCIVHQHDIPLEDRIAFAAIHFSDQYFMKSVKELFTDACLYRTLFGLLITGISYEKATHDLLSQYVDYTGDIQTATILLVVGRCFVKEQSWPIAYSAEEIASSDFELLTIEDSGACTKLDEHIRRSFTIVCDYLDMLNVWGMWVQRARLDCILGWRRNAILLESRVDRNTVQAEICCQFCPQNITLDESDISLTSVPSAVLIPTTRSNISTTSSTAPSIPAREMACLHCLKPLPKCILCRRHMGSYVQTECHELGRLSSWFTWCQKCRHGGHMAHLWHWFNGHAECAANGCLCNCQMEDINIIGLNVEPPQPCLFCEDSC
uniref:Zinc_ribbon_16 domain-containing protein n=1 Tax=Onchocerca volvulus TaxID=6282 RepID=A0A8R1TU61_ONCVO